MEQKDIKLEIISALLKKESHVRELAKTLGTNHMKISRTVAILYKENAVDYKMEGKNKVFHLKKNIEAKNYAYITEYYQLQKTLEKYPGLRKIITAIQEKKDIQLAILFGSYAKGLAKKESDIDIYIETEDKTIKKDLEYIDSRLSIKIGPYDRQNLLIKEIEKKNVIIKGIENYYEKTRIFA